MTAAAEQVASEKSGARWSLILKKRFEEHTVSFYERELQEPDFLQVARRFYGRRVVQRIAGREDAARIKFSSPEQLTPAHLVFILK